MPQFRNLVFEGGGAKGIAYVGALEVLEQQDVAPSRARPSTEHFLAGRETAKVYQWPQRARRSKVRFYPDDDDDDEEDDAPSSRK